MTAISDRPIAQHGFIDLNAKDTTQHPCLEGRSKFFGDGLTTKLYPISLPLMRYEDRGCVGVCPVCEHDPSTVVRGWPIALRVFYTFAILGCGVLAGGC